MSINLAPYLGFDGNCAEAMRFYENVLEGTIVAMIANGDTPAAQFVPESDHRRIMHARLEADGIVLMAGDAPSSEKYDGMRGFSLALSYPDVDRGKKVFDAFADGGKVTMQWEETFWTERFGMVTDKYGTPWIINAGAAKEMPS